MIGHTAVADTVVKGKSPEEVLETLRATISSDELELAKLIEEEDRAALFQRKGDGHQIDFAYPGFDPEAPVDGLVTATWTSKKKGYIDDIAFTVVAHDDGTSVRGFSCSRVGGFDFFMNKKHLKVILEATKLDMTELQFPKAAKPKDS